MNLDDELFWVNLVSAMGDSKNRGVEIFSPWYSEAFVKEKLEDKQNSLARMESIGEIEDAEKWHERSKRRFERNWDRLSNETKRAYQSSARHFGKYLGLKRSDSDVSKIVARLIILSYMEASTLVEEYAMWMEDEELSPNTINLRLAALRWFVDAARMVGWVEWQLDVKNVKGGKIKDTRGPSDAEFRRILRVVNSTGGKSGTRNRLLVYLLAFMGLRIGSAISLDLENIDFDRRMIKVRWKAKGEGVARYVWRPVGPETFSALEEWLDVRGRDSGPVIIRLDRPTRGNERISIRSAQQIIHNIGVEASTRKPLNPHAFRHFHATDALEAEADPRRVMKSTGHKDTRTLLVHYDDSDDSAAREVSAAMESRWLLELDKFEEDDEGEIHGRLDELEEVDADGEIEDEFGVISSTEAIANAVEYDRIPTGMSTVDDLLGGRLGNQGIVVQSIILLGGFPGIGKSTLARQISYNICEANGGAKVLYASGEESADQIGEALARLGCDHERLLLFPEKSLNRICAAAKKKKIDVLVIDSVNTVAVDACSKPPGSISQLKAVGNYLLEWCKGVGGSGGSGISVILITHVDKKGSIAGPKALEHHVDAVFSFMSPSKRSTMRSLGCEGKNRFGPATKEIFFEMTGKGLVERIVEPNDFGYDDDA